jgi:hypothetical protein
VTGAFSGFKRSAYERESSRKASKGLGIGKAAGAEARAGSENERIDRQ